MSYAMVNGLLWHQWHYLETLFITSSEQYIWHLSRHRIIRLFRDLFRCNFKFDGTAIYLNCLKYFTGKWCRDISTAVSAEFIMDSTKIERIGGPRSRSASCAPSFVEEARLMNRHVRLARSRNRLRKFSEFTHLEEECIDSYQKERVCSLSNSSDDLQSNCGQSSKSCSNLISVHGRFGGSVEVICV